jgi:ferritin-like metal-binding protein YciE
MSYFVFSPTSFVILTVAKCRLHAYLKDVPMATKNPKDIVVRLLSDIRQGTERTSKVFQEISQAAQNPEIKQVLEARVFISGQLLAKLDRCFQLIGFRIAEYVALIEVADVAGNHGVGVLLESCLADKLAFAERARRLIRKVVEAKVPERARV